MCKSRCDVLSVSGWYVWYLSEVPVIPANSGCTRTPCGTTDITGNPLFWRIRKILVSVYTLFLTCICCYVTHVEICQSWYAWCSLWVSWAHQARGQCGTLRHSASNSVKLKTYPAALCRWFPGGGFMYIRLNVLNCFIIIGRNLCNFKLVSKVKHTSICWFIGRYHHEKKEPLNSKWNNGFPTSLPLWKFARLLTVTRDVWGEIWFMCHGDIKFVCHIIPTDT